MLATLGINKLLVNSGTRFVYPFLPAISRGLGVSLEATGLLVSLRWLASLTMPGAVRLIAPHEQRRRLALTGLILLAAGAALTVVGVYAFAVAGFALMGLGKPTSDIATQAHISDHVPYAERGRALSTVELAWGGSLLIGAPLLGWVLARGGWRAPFLVLAVLYLIAMWPVGRVIQDGPATKRERPKLSLDRRAVVFLVGSSLFIGAAELVFVVFGAWLEDSFEASIAGLGIASVVIALGELSGEGIAAAISDRLGKLRTVSLGVIVSIVGYSAVPLFGGSYWVALVIFAIGLLGFELAIVSSIPYATEIRPQSRARLLALMMMVNGVFRALGTGLGAPIYSRFGFTTNIVIAVVANVAALASLLWLARTRPVAAAETADE